MDKNNYNHKEYQKAYQKAYRESKKEELKLKKETNKELNNEYKKAYREANKEKLKEYQKAYREANKEKLKEQQKNKYVPNPTTKLSSEERKERRKISVKKYDEKNKEKRKQYLKEYNEINKEKAKEYRKEWWLKKMQDPLFRLKHSIRNSINKSIKRNGFKKLSRTHLILGCSFDEFKIYLESKFESWMNWDNYGLYNGTSNYGWDIDHIIPSSSGVTEEETIKLNHYTNLQPLCSYYNRNIKKDNNPTN